RVDPVGGEVGAGDDEQTLVDAECGEGVAVVGGLGAPALVGGDHEAYDRCGTEACEHGAEEPFMPGHVHERDFLAGRQRGPGEAELDGEAAAGLLGEAVRFDAGQGAHERGLAVVDVPGGRDHLHQRAAPPSAPSAVPVRAVTSARAAVTAATRASSLSTGTQRRSSRQASPRTVPITAGVPRRSGAASSTSSAIAQPGSGTPAPPPPPTRPACGTTRPSSWAARCWVRSCNAAGSVRSAARTGGTGPERVASRAARASLSARTARASGCRARRAMTSARPSKIPAWGP